MPLSIELAYRSRPVASVLLVLALAGLLPPQFGANYRDAPIRYGTHQAHDPITGLLAGIQAGRIKLEFDESSGYLQALLEHLGIPRSSQNLVFSKTSLQIHKLAPDNPRAIYFGDEVYVGFVPGGSVMEITAMDPRRGPIFHSLDQVDRPRPRLRRRTSECLTCHGGPRTSYWPGHLIRSVYTKPTGDIETRVGSFVTTQDSPCEQRWGGWYVTGTHGAMRHMGNTTVSSPTGPVELDLDAGANTRDLSDRFRTDRYLTPHRDIVALLVLEHQTEMHNLMARAG